MISLFLLPLILLLNILLSALVPIFKFLFKSGFIILFAFFVVVIYINFYTDISALDPMPDYFNIGLNTVDDYAYFGFRVSLAASLVVFLIRAIRFISKTIRRSL